MGRISILTAVFSVCGATWSRFVAPAGGCLPHACGTRSAALHNITCQRASRLLPPESLPDFFDGEAVAQLAVVMPRIPVDLALEGLRLSLDAVEVGAQAVLRRFLVNVALEGVSSARGTRHGAVGAI